MIQVRANGRSGLRAAWLGLGFAAVGVGVALGLRLAPERVEPVAAPLERDSPFDAGEWDALRAEVRANAAAIARLERAATSRSIPGAAPASPYGAGPTSEEDPEPETGAALVARIRGLEARAAGELDERRRLDHRVTTLEHAPRTAAAGAPPEAKPETDWSSLQELIDAWHVDEEATRVELTLRSEAELLALYGPPTNTWPTDSGLTWLYGDRWDPTGESYAREVYFVFANGRLAKVWVDAR